MLKIYTFSSKNFNVHLRNIIEYILFAIHNYIFAGFVLFVLSQAKSLHFCTKCVSPINFPQNWNVPLFWSASITFPSSYMCIHHLNNRVSRANEWNRSPFTPSQTSLPLSPAPQLHNSRTPPLIPATKATSNYTKRNFRLHLHT